MFRLSRFPALALLFVVAASATTVASAASDVVASEYRVVFGDQAPLNTSSGFFTLTNRGSDEARVALIQEPAEHAYVRLQETEFTLPGGEARRVAYTYTVPADAAPGIKGEAVKYLVNREAEAGTGGQLAAGTALLFTSRVTAIGVTAIEAPEEARPATNATGRVVAVSTLKTNASAELVVDLVHGVTGRTIASESLGRHAFAPGATVGVPFTFPTGRLEEGEHHFTARAIAVEPATAPRTTHALAKPFALGTRDARITIDGIVDRRDGTAVVSFTVTNNGSLPAVVQPRITLAPLTANVSGAERVLDAVTVPPGGTLKFDAEVDLAAGSFMVSVVNAASAASALALAGGGTEFEMREAREPLLENFLPPRDDPAYWWVVIALALILVLMVVLLVVAFRKKRTPADDDPALPTVASPDAPAAPVVVPQAPAPARPDEGSVDAWLRALEEDEATDVRAVSPAATDAEGVRAEAAPPAPEAVAEPEPEPVAAPERPADVPAQWPAPDAHAVAVALRATSATDVAADAAVDGPGDAAPALRHATLVVLDVASLPHGLAQVPSAEVFAASQGALGDCRAVAYAVAATDAAAREAFHVLTRLGYEAVVRIRRDAGAQDARVAFALDLLERADGAAAVAVATHDAGFATVAQRLAAGGTAVDVAGQEGAIPAALLEVARRVRVTAPAFAR